MNGTDGGPAEDDRPGRPDGDRPDGPDGDRPDGSDNDRPDGRRDPAGAREPDGGRAVAADARGSAPAGGRPRGRGSPFAPHDPAETAAMLDAVGAEDVEALFDVPGSVRFDEELGIEARREATVRRELRETLARNDDCTELLGRGHYAYHVPSVVDHLADRGEFLTSYTQYQPEVQQGFLQALFEYQSLLVELTGLGVANCSMYDAATALGEAATMSARLAASRRHDADGSRVLVPGTLFDRRRSVLANYVAGTELTVETYPTVEGTADVDALADRVDDGTLLVYAESPSARGGIDPALDAVGDVAADADALYAVGSDPVALSVLEAPAAVGADFAVGDASVLGVGRAYGTGLGMFATRERFLRQVPGRLVGAADDADGRRGFTLTLQTREQHIRRERATSNICTNQAWVALRTAMHAFSLGPDGLVELARRSIDRAADLAARLDGLAGLHAPVDDRRPFREFAVGTDRPARAVADELLDRGFAVHVLDDGDGDGDGAGAGGGGELGVCVAGVTDRELDRFVAAAGEVAR